MKYLHGDSSAFSEQYDFLATLRGFVECAGRLCMLSHEIDGLEGGLRRRRADRQDVLGQVQRFADDLTDYLSRATEGAVSETIDGIARQQLELLASATARAKASAQRDSEADEGRTRDAIAARGREMREHIERFFLEVSLPLLETAFSMRVAPEGVSLAASFGYRGGISASYELDPAAGGWGSPLKVSAFCQGMNVQVGLKRKFLSKELAPEIVLLDDFVVTGVDLEQGQCGIRLRKKADSPSDSLLVSMTSADGQVAARITRTEGDQPETIDTEPSDVSKLTELWDAISRRAEPALARKRSLTWVRLDDQDVLAGGLVLELVDRLVDEFAPIVAAIERHSPNPEELSLKIETSDGRREEIYVRKADLAQHLTELPDELLERFVHLDIFPPMKLGSMDIDLT